MLLTKSPKFGIKNVWSVPDVFSDGKSIWLLWTVICETLLPQRMFLWCYSVDYEVLLSHIYFWYFHTRGFYQFSRKLTCKHIFTLSSMLYTVPYSCKISSSCLWKLLGNILMISLSKLIPTTEDWKKHINWYYTDFSRIRKRLTLFNFSKEQKLIFNIN